MFDLFYILMSLSESTISTGFNQCWGAGANAVRKNYREPEQDPDPLNLCI